MTKPPQLPQSSPSQADPGRDDVLRIEQAKADDIERLHPWFDAVSAHLPPAIRHGMRVALEEVVLNAAVHGFAANASGAITVRLRVSPGSAALSVEDSGRPFDPSTVPVHHQPASLLEARPGGLGLVLLHHYCRDISYERVADRNRLIMRFPLPI
jgi:anti-sigma regulatory factor (Ser/Thr protein kinase)